MLNADDHASCINGPMSSLPSMPHLVSSSIIATLMHTHPIVHLSQSLIHRFVKRNRQENSATATKTHSTHPSLMNKQQKPAKPLSKNAKHTKSNPAPSKHLNSHTHPSQHYFVPFLSLSHKNPGGKSICNL
jgi:hypothetical protein